MKEKKKGKKLQKIMLRFDCGDKEGREFGGAGRSNSVRRAARAEPGLEGVESPICCGAWTNGAWCPGHLGSD